MNLARTTAAILITTFLASYALSEEMLPDNPGDFDKGYMAPSGVIVDICIYEQEYLPRGSNKLNGIPVQEGTWIRRAVVTGVHRGNIEIGTKIDMHEYIVRPPKFLPRFRSTVEGELRTYFYFGTELPEPKDGRHIVDHNSMSFARGRDKEVVAFLKELHAKSGTK